MFNFINRDHVYGTVFGVVLCMGLAFMSGCGDKEDDTADSADSSTTTTVTTGTTTGVTTTTGTTTTGTTTTGTTTTVNTGDTAEEGS